jgi:hypothetical protein
MAVRALCAHLPPSSTHACRHCTAQSEHSVVCLRPALVDAHAVEASVLLNAVLVAFDPSLSRLCVRVTPARALG